MGRAGSHYCCELKVRKFSFKARPTHFRSPRFRAIPQDQGVASRNNVFHDVPMHIRETEVSARAAEGQLLMIEAEQL